MRTEWDYSKLAEAYLKRPDYSNSAIGALDYEHYIRNVCL